MAHFEVPAGIKSQWNDEDSSGNQTSVIHNDKSVYNIDYIEAPILAKLLLFRKSLTHLSITLGSSISYLTFAKGKLYEDGKQVLNNYNIKDMYNSVDANFILGTGIERQVGLNKILFDIRLSFGMFGIYKKLQLPSNYVQPDLAYNQSIYFLLGYEFKL